MQCDIRSAISTDSVIYILTPRPMQYEKTAGALICKITFNRHTQLVPKLVIG
jgi:hypothetical protein